MFITQLELRAVDQKDASSKFRQLSKNWEQPTKEVGLTFFVSTFRDQEKAKHSYHLRNCGRFLWQQQQHNISFICMTIIM